LYVPFAAYGDGGAGWMVAVDTLTPSLASAFAGGPSGTRAFANGGMWGSGGPAVDLAGNVYDTTGNGPNDVQPLVGGSVPHPVLYAIDAISMSLLWNSTADQLFKRSA
jgi:hypothetical protein